MENAQTPSLNSEPNSVRTITIRNPQVTYEVEASKKLTSRERDRVRLTLYWLDEVSLEDKERLVDGQRVVFVTSAAMKACMKLRLGSLVTVKVLAIEQQPTESGE